MEALSLIADSAAGAAPQGSLLLDANPVSRRLTSLLLTRSGAAAVALAGDVATAASMLQQLRYALMVVDMDTLAADGLVALRAAIPNEQRPWLVALQSVDSSLSETAAVFFDEVLSKPLSQQAIAPLLARAASTETAATIDDFNAAIWSELLGLFKAGGVAQLVGALVTDLPEQQQRYESATAAADLAALRTIAHALRGTSMQLGAETLARLCGRAEIAAADGHALLAFELAATMMQRHRSLIARLQQEAALAARA
jgi:HPt (histidine-containing phosphotransfer) domain-containing protein